MSKPEQKIAEILTKNGIRFKREISFKNLYSFRGKKRNYFFFDFGVYNEKGELEYIIEYDGEFHFKRIERIISVTQFKRAQEYDRKKNQYCLMNKIKLIRIPYWDLDKITMDRILNEESYVVKTKWHNDLL